MNPTIDRTFARVRIYPNIYMCSRAKFFSAGVYSGDPVIRSACKCGFCVYIMVHICNGLSNKPCIACVGAFMRRGIAVLRRERGAFRTRLQKFFRYCRKMALFFFFFLLGTVCSC